MNASQQQTTDHEAFGDRDWFFKMFRSQICRHNLVTRSACCAGVHYYGRLVSAGASLS